ncbi:bile acid:sodium symporter family protein [Flexivirga aerilata]|uniref:bile acid:sodium symporter family protein n=1 Tax=Flexivirga aerilata TaxID=1656889 RepID=UPI0031B64B4E
MNLVRKLRIDGFVLAILATVAIASVLPAGAGFAPTLDTIVTAAIALLFFLYGARMHPREALDGLKHWRLHTLILAFTFVLFPLVGIALRVLEPSLLSADLYTGVLYLTLVPSTVQSSIAFTSMARGNVAGAIVSASASNLLGVLLTPLLVIAMASLHLLGTGGSIQISARAIVDICAQLLVPFLVGQLARPLIGAWVEKHSGSLKYVDRGSIVLVVYAAFSEGVREGIWHAVSAWQIGFLVLLSVLLVVVMLWLTGQCADRLGFDCGNRIAVQFCGTKKSLASGLPMAAVLFAGQPVSIIVLPLMVFHQVQLMICSWLAARYGSQPASERSTTPLPTAR